MEQTTRTNPVVVIITLLIGVIIGYLIGTLTATTAVGTAIKESGTQAQNNIGQNNNNPDGSLSGEVRSDLVTGDANEPAFTIAVSSLGATQQAMLRTMGISEDEITITKGMVACAEVEIGAGRVVEIQNGAAVTMGEGVTLVRCYNGN